MTRKQREALAADQKKKRSMRRVRLELTESQLEHILTAMSEWALIERGTEMGLPIAESLERSAATIEKQRVKPRAETVRLSSFRRSLISVTKHAQKEYARYVEICKPDERGSINHPAFDDEAWNLKFYYEGRLTALREILAHVTTRLLKVK